MGKRISAAGRAWGIGRVGTLLAAASLSGLLAVSQPALAADPLPIARPGSEADAAPAAEEASPVATPAATPAATPDPAAQPAPRGPAGAFATNSKAPIEIEADTLEVAQDRQTATFIGNVLARQDRIRLKADRLVVTYAEQSQGGTEITRIDAKGNVHVTSDEEQSAAGEWAIYQVGPREITMGDNVILREGENVVRGKKLTIDLNTGFSRISGGATAESPESGGNGRVKGLFHPSTD